MNIAIWVSGKMNGQVMMNWAAEKGNATKAFVTMEPSAHGNLPFTTSNIDALKKVSDSNKVDLIFKSVKKTGEENFDAIDALLKFAKEKYAIEAVAVDPTPEVAHVIRNSAKKFKLKTVLLPK